MNIRNAIFITVRTGSTRLPRKALLPIQGKSTIEHLIDRLKRSRLSDGIILCTTTLEADSVLCDIAQKAGISYFCGPVEDKLIRWLGAADHYGVEYFVTADGDDIFCEPELIDLAFAQYQKTKTDFIEGAGLICGSFTYGIAVSALRRVCEIKATDDTEMMWTYFKDTGLFRVEQLRDVPALFVRDDIRMTLDYPEDLAFFTAVIEALGTDNPSFSLRDIVAYLDKNPDIIRINQFRQQEFLDNQKKKTKLVIKEGDNER